MKITQLSAGRDRSVVLASDGKAYGWGSVKLLGAVLPPGYPGELCTSSATEIGHNRFAQPVAQWLNPGTPFASVADGYIDTLGVCRAGTVHSCRPVVSSEGGAEMSPVAGLPPFAVQMVLTESAGFALYADGKVWSWGLPAYGQLGRPGTGSHQAPAVVAGLPPITALASGNSHLLALDRSGRVGTWGANAAGQLGNGTLAESARPVHVVTQVPMAKVAAGDTHSLTVDKLGRLWAWGSNNFGQLGDAKAAYLTAPTRIKTGFPVQQVDAGMFYTVATSTQGDVFTWGWNGMGQLGHAELKSTATPQRVRQLSNVTHITAGVGHVLVLGSTGLHAWGDNRASACGQFPSVTVQAAPVAVQLA